MQLVLGTRLAQYEITAAIGEGGMGEVWRAKDTKLGRDVAIKDLPEEFTKGAERLARFEREARILASLEHSNIASIYGLEEVDGTRFLAMQLAEGEDLADRLRRGAIPLDESLAIARQIADALEAAHEKGVIHRDLKPANIKLGSEGQVKVLDFGLAKAMESEESDDDFLNSPTMVRAATHAGVILGTTAYMSPEQARGKKVDKRADIWAFGVVLWEMLTGTRLFSGETVSDTLAEVLKTGIDFETLPAETPATIRRLLRQCLERNPKNRLHDIADVRIALDDAMAGRGEEKPAGTAVTTTTTGRGWKLAATCSVVALVVGAVAGYVATMRKGGAVTENRITFERLTYRPGHFVNARFSPDGKTLLVRQTITPDCMLWTIDLERGSLTRQTFEGDHHSPEWGPDAKEIVASVSTEGIRELHAKGLGGESAHRTLARAEEDIVSGTLSRDGRYLVYESLSSENGSDLHVLDTQGDAKPRPFATSPFDEIFPQFSPDRKWIAFVSDESGRPEVYVMPFEGTGAKTQISTEGGNGPRWSRDGRELFFVSGERLASVAIEPGDPLRESAPRVLFVGKFVWDRPDNFDVAPDGQSFVMVQSSAGDGVTEVVRATLNWSRELEKRFAK